MDYKGIIKSIREKNYQPVYFLHGEEPYFIDLISNVIAGEVLADTERDFNQTIIYGKEVEPLQLISLAKQFPMMSDRQVIIIKEAQDIKNWDAFVSYFENPQPSTVLTICYKYKKFDSRKKVFKAATKAGVIFQSDKVKDYQLVAWIENMVKAKGYEITPKASNLLAEFLGNDLGRIIGELEKLSLLLEKGTKINDVHIEENIGISKDYNIFELTNSIAAKDLVSANKIIKYFEQNPKAGNMVVVTGNLFSFFQRLMQVHFLSQKTPEAIASNLKVHPFVARQLLTQSRSYPPKKIAQNIAYLQAYDLKSKGIGSVTNPYELMKELVFLLVK